MNLSAVAWLCLTFHRYNIPMPLLECEFFFHALRSSSYVDGTGPWTMYNSYYALNIVVRMTLRVFAQTTVITVQQFPTIHSCQCVNWKWRSRLEKYSPVNDSNTMCDRLQCTMKWPQQCKTKDWKKKTQQQQLEIMSLNQEIQFTYEFLTLQQADR